MTVHLFGGVWSPSCASFAVRQTAENHGQKFDSTTVKAVLGNFYVDNCLQSLESDERATQVVRELGQLLNLGGFRLTKWMSNSCKELDSIQSEERAKEVSDRTLSQLSLPIQRALGVHWDTDEDVFGIKAQIKGEPTHQKRFVEHNYFCL